MSTSALTTYNMWRSNLLRNRPIFQAHNAATQSIPNSTWTTLTFPTLDVDNMGGWNSGTNTYTCQLLGWYRVFATVGWAANATPARAISVNIQGTRFQGFNDTPTSTGVTSSTVNGVEFQLGIGWTIQIQVDQNSGGALGTATSPFLTSFGLVWSRNY